MILSNNLSVWLSKFSSQHTIGAEQSLQKEISSLLPCSWAICKSFNVFPCHISDEIYIEKIVPQWAETQEDKQNAVDYTGMYDQKTVQYKKVCPFIFMYLHINHDGIVSPCTLDWPREVKIGDAKKNSASEIWHGKTLKDLQISQLQGKRDQIPFCKDCSAPMVCCD